MSALLNKSFSHPPRRSKSSLSSNDKKDLSPLRNTHGIKKEETDSAYKTAD